MRKRIFGLLAALVLCLGLLPGTAWAEEEPVDGGNITETGLYFNSGFAGVYPPKVKTVYTAGQGMVTWIPTVENEKITHGKFILENTTFDLPQKISIGTNPVIPVTPSVLNYTTSSSSGVEGNIEVILKGSNSVTVADSSSSFIYACAHSANDIASEVTIKGEEGGSLTYTNTATGGGGYTAISAGNSVFIEKAEMNLTKGNMEISGLIQIKDSDISITLDGVPSYKYALHTMSGSSTQDIGLTVENSRINIDSKSNGIYAPSLCHFTDSEITVRSAFGSGYAIAANSRQLQVIRSAVTAIGGSNPTGALVDDGNLGILDGSTYWNELENSIHLAGSMKISPEPSNKTLHVRSASTVCIENGAAFDVTLYEEAVFTAANVKNLTTASTSSPGTIRLTDEIPSMTVTGGVGRSGIKLEYAGNNPASAVVFTAPTAADAEMIRFDERKFEQKENQIIWKQTPLAAPTDLSWDGAKAQWGAVENAQGYTVQLYKDDVAFGEPVTVTSGTEYDFTEQITETGDYTFRVKAMGGDSILHADSEYSEASGEFDYIAPERFTVSFDAQGGTAVAGQTVVDGETVSKPSAPTRSGYIFGGWFTNADCSSAYDFSAPVTGDLTLYAKWTPKPADPPPAAKTHTVRFLDGGTELASHTVQEGSKAAPPDEPVKRGYRFAGWHTDPEGTEAFDFETPVTGDLTLYAKWTALSGGGDAPSGGGSSGRDDDDDEPRPPATAATTITQNPDGSTTKTTTDRRTGAVTTVTTAPDGTSVTVVTDQNGHVVSTEASVPKGAAVLPTAPEGEVKITVKGGGRAEVTLPAESAGPGTVAVLVSPEGTKTVVRKSILTENGVVLTVQGSAVVRLEDRGRIFPDVPEGWKAEAAAFVSAREILNGGTDGLFRPDAPMTRAMLAVALHNLEGNPSHGTAAAFLDVPEHVWYAEAVSWASARGIVTGYTGEIFGPGDHITREQLAVMLWRAAGRPAPSSRVLPFPDADQAADYAREALCWAVEHGIIHGGSGGTLDPKGLATRAQAAQMLKNFLENG